jgi:2-oxoglutarate/2-oxoacid ferredoxin oxidoreductase subunit alpha
MPNTDERGMIITDGSRLIIEALARAGAEAFIGYPITPANLLYSYAASRIPIMLPAPDEITTVQWMAGLSAGGKLPVTATSFPGYALMIESVNMAFMMELPMLIILVQRLGPSTGTATCGAQGDLALLNGQISGGSQLPVFCISDYHDCWHLSAEALKVATELRSPVVLLTSQEGLMTRRSYELSRLGEIPPLPRRLYRGREPYRPYAADDSLVPEFLPVGNQDHQVRLNASTHDAEGILQHSTPEALANTLRLDRKAPHNIAGYTFYEYDDQQDAETLVLAFDITAAAARDAVLVMRNEGERVSLLVPKTLIPVPDDYYGIIRRYRSVVIAEENVNAQYAKILFGQKLPAGIRTLGGLGRMIRPEEIVSEARRP